MVISNFKGDCVHVNGSGLSLKNVQIDACGGSGVVAASAPDAIITDSSASYTNVTGFYVDGGVIQNSVATYNKGLGSNNSSSAATQNVLVYGNSGAGIFTSGAVANTVSLINGGDGLDVSPGTVTNSNADSNSGHGFNLGLDTCYLGISSEFSTGTEINSGVAMAGSVASCP